MKSGKTETKRASLMPSDLLRGDSLFAVLIFVVVGVFLCTLVASVWNNIVFQRDVKERASAENAREVGNVLAKAAEALIATDELSTLRRVVAESGVEHGLKSCRVLLPDGGVLADADPGGITVIDLPDAWEGEVSHGTEAFTKTAATLTFPLHVPARGSATLELIAGLDDQLTGGLGPQTAQMAIACLALASMLLVHRHARFRLKAIGAIHEVLLAVKDEHTDISALELDPELGLEAVAWNKLLGEKQSVQICSAIQQVKDAVHERSETADELTATFDAIPYGLVLVDDEMQIQHVNGAAAVLLQAERAQLLHAHIPHVIQDETVVAGVRDVVQGPASKRIVHETEQDGSVTAGVLRFTLCPIRHEEALYGLIMIEDVTQQRVAAVAMNSFLAKAAHELRTPLTNIRLFVEEALEHCERDVAATSKALNVINGEAQRLERTVSEILSVSEIEAGSFQMRRDDVHMGVLLGQLKANHEAQASNKRITLEFDLPPKLPAASADRDKVALALHNLLGNALKYTPEGGHIVVMAAVDKDRLSIAVTDTGIGISADEIERVFDKFYRSKDPQAAGIKGSGLGLAISREVARLHGGDITAESEPGKGSTFTLTLPILEEVP